MMGNEKIREGSKNSQGGANMLTFDELKNLALKLFKLYGVVAIPATVERKKDGSYSKRPIGKWKDFYPQNEKEIEEFWELAIADKELLQVEGKPSEVTRNPKLAALVSAIAILTGKRSKITVIDIDDIETFLKSTGMSSKEFKKLLDYTFAVKTPRGGIHLYFDYDPNVKTTTRKGLGFDVRNDGGLVITAPSRCVTCKEPIYIEIGGLRKMKDLPKIPDKIKKLLSDKEGGDRRGPDGGTATAEVVGLTPKSKNRIINKLVEIFYPIWLPGYRHNLTISLIGWLYKKGFTQEEIKEVINKIAIKAGDEEIEERLKQVRYHFEEGRIEELKTEGKDLIGWKGILETLETMLNDETISEEAYHQTLEELQNLFPKDIKTYNLYIRTSKEPPMGYANVLREGCIYAWKVKQNQGFTLTKKIVSFAIKELIVHKDYFGEGEIYEAKVITEDGQHLTFIGDVSTIVSTALNKFALGAADKRTVKMALSQIIMAFKKRGIAKIDETPLQTGIFLSKDGKQLIYNLPGLKELELDEGKIKEALTYLDIYVNALSEKKKEHVATVVKFAIAAPFYFVRKQLKKRPFRWLFLVGEPDTGKTADMKMCFYIWGSDYQDRMINASSIETSARLNKLASLSTLPLVINEADAIFPKDLNKKAYIRNILKDLWENELGRFLLTKESHLTRNVALSPFGFTANFTPHLTDAEKKRIKVIGYPIEAKIDISSPEAKAYEDFMSAAVDVFPHIGKAILEALPHDLIISKLKESNDTTFEKFAEELLKELYSRFMDEIPEWISLEAEELDDIEEEENPEVVKNDILSLILKLIIDTAQKLDKNLTMEALRTGDLVKLIRLAEAADITLPVTVTTVYDEKLGASVYKLAFRKEILRYLRENGVEVAKLSDLAHKLQAELKKTSIRNRGWVGTKVVLINLSEMAVLMPQLNFADREKQEFDKNPEKEEVIPYLSEEEQGLPDNKREDLLDLPDLEL